jgi:hypothetical protein
MKTDQSGTRTGEWEPGVYQTRSWPPRGSVIDLPDLEAAHYCEVGMAEPVAVFADVEVATVPPAEQRVLTRERTDDSLDVGMHSVSDPSVPTTPARRGPGRPRNKPVQPQGGEA